MRLIKVFAGITLAFLLWLAAFGAVVWYEAGATIEQQQERTGDMP